MTDFQRSGNSFYASRGELTPKKIKGGAEMNCRFSLPTVRWEAHVAFFNGLAQFSRQSGTELALVIYLTIILGNSKSTIFKKALNFHIMSLLNERETRREILSGVRFF